MNGRMMHETEEIVRDVWAVKYPGHTIRDIYERADNVFGKAILTIFAMDGAGVGPRFTRQLKART